jgi:CubicO group peptidase (beta-lactamase class C family)
MNEAKYYLTFLVIFILFISLPAQQDLQKKVDEIDRVMKAFTDLDQFSGCILVARNGQPFYTRAFGMADKDFAAPNTMDSKFNIGSIGKTFTGVSIMQLAEKGKLDINDPVIKYLKDFPFGDKIKIFHLLTHTSGMGNYFAHPEFRNRISQIRSVSDALPLIYDQELLFDTPGEKYSYSNSGIVTLGAVIEQVSGQSYPQYIQEHILQPTGMTNTGIHYLEQVVENRAVGYMKSATGRYRRNIFMVPPANADGGIETTAGDLLKFDQALYEDKLLSAESRQKMFTPFLHQYGFCWRIEEFDGHKKIYHGGGAPGVSAQFDRYINDGYTLIVLSNYDNGAPAVASTIQAILFDQDYEYPRETVEAFLYRTMLEKGSDYLTENFDRLLQENNYRIKNSRLLNILGYSLLAENELDRAILIFKENVRLFPDEPNPYDSLGEAYLKKGERENALKYYQKALEIDPEFPSARAAVEELKGS